MTRVVLLELLGMFRALRSGLGPPSCRFVPSCTNYAEAALTSHGTLRAVLLILKRLSRCHPHHPGGFDPVPTV